MNRFTKFLLLLIAAVALRYSFWSLKIIMCLTVVVGSAFITLLMPTICLSVLGFGPTGLRKRSLASWYKSVANRRGWSLKGIFALLRSASVRGIPRRTHKVIVCVGALAGCCLAYKIIILL